MFGWVVVLPGVGPGPGANVPYNGAVSPEPKALTWSWVRSGPWRICPGMGSSIGLFGLGGGGSSARAAVPGRPERARAASDAATRNRFMVLLLTGSVAGDLRTAPPSYRSGPE